jgi:hypothetical protein
MRKGPKSSSRVPRPAPQNDPDAARAGIRALDCGDESTDDRTTIVRRSDPDTPPPAAGDSDSLGEQRQSV